MNDTRKYIDDRLDELRKEREQLQLNRALNAARQGKGLR